MIPGRLVSPRVKESLPVGETGRPLESLLRQILSATRRPFLFQLGEGFYVLITGFLLQVGSGNGKDSSSQKSLIPERPWVFILHFIFSGLPLFSFLSFKRKRKGKTKEKIENRRMTMGSPSALESFAKTNPF